MVETENEAEAVPEDFKTKKITYKDFTETWSGLLDAAKMKVCNNMIKILLSYGIEKFM